MEFELLEFWLTQSPIVKFHAATVLSRTEFSSEVDLQNSVTPKPFSGESCMSNGKKAGRVPHVFGVQLWYRIYDTPGVTEATTMLNSVSLCTIEA
jgi:hypothetical protein